MRAKNSAVCDLQFQFLVELPPQRLERGLAGVYGAAEQSPMVRIPDVRPRIAQLHQIAVGFDANDCGNGIAEV